MGMGIISIINQQKNAGFNNCRGYLFQLQEAARVTKSADKVIALEKVAPLGAEKGQFYDIVTASGKHWEVKVNWARLMHDLKKSKAPPVTSNQWLIKFGSG